MIAILELLLAAKRRPWLLHHWLIERLLPIHWLAHCRGLKRLVVAVDRWLAWIILELRRILRRELTRRL